MSEDRIFEVYEGSRGTEATIQHARERIHWVTERVGAAPVLDVGCSQGIIPLLLAREGISVLGVDINANAIDFAREKFAAEPEEIRQRVEFRVGDFLELDFGERRFPFILMTEVLEHLHDPALFVKRCAELLAPEGELIIQVPFGLFPHPDHYQTWYLRDFLELVSPYVALREIDVIGGRICFRAGHRDAAEARERDADLLEFLLLRSEQCFLEKEKKYTAKIERLQQRNEVLTEKLQRQEERIGRYKSRSEELLGKVNRLVEAREREEGLSSS